AKLKPFVALAFIILVLYTRCTLIKNPSSPLSYRRGEDVYHRGTTLFHCIHCMKSSLVKCLTHTTSSSTSFKLATPKGYLLISYTGSHHIPALFSDFF